MLKKLNSDINEQVSSSKQPTNRNVFCQEYFSQTKVCFTLMAMLINTNIKLRQKKSHFKCFWYVHEQVVHTSVW